MAGHYYTLSPALLLPKLPLKLCLRHLFAPTCGRSVKQMHDMLWTLADLWELSSPLQSPGCSHSVALQALLSACVCKGAAAPGLAPAPFQPYEHSARITFASCCKDNICLMHLAWNVTRLCSGHAARPAPDCGSLALLLHTE